MTSRNTDSSQGDGSNSPAPLGPPDQQRSRAGNMVFKSGPLFLSSKGIGWTSWKKRWFILTRTSLVFFRSDPNAVPQKGSEVNLTLGGIDLNNSGSVVVKEDKKLLTVLFPDGRDGRTFTLKAETLEDLHDWKAALESALTQAPSAALVVGQNGIFKQDQVDPVDGSSEQAKDKMPVKSTVVGRPILLALEDVDGTPSFLEKALKFIEEYGVKVEGILRQAADVEDVERRVQEYEQGNIEFSLAEDPHVIADCVKHVLRELPSSPVPASCCNALLEACRTDRDVRVSAMRTAICETFPEPNRRLLQRILTMMQSVASHQADNRMSSSAVAACMAPLLLRPLLAGDCELENDFDVGGDGSAQLLQAAAAANHAQSIVITLLEEYDKIFGDGAVSQDFYSDSEDSGSESGEPSDDDDESFEGDETDDATDDLHEDTDDLEHASGRTYSEAGDSGDDLYGNKSHEASSSNSDAPEEGDDFRTTMKSSSSSPQTSLTEHDNLQRRITLPNQTNHSSCAWANESEKPLEDVSAETSGLCTLVGQSPSTSIKKSTSISNAPVCSGRHRTFWGRTPARKNLSMESIDYPIEDEAEIQRLEEAKIELQNRIAEEAKRNTNLQESLEMRKRELHKRRLALEEDVSGLQKQLQRERDLRMTLEAGLKMPQGPLPFSASMDEKTKADLEEVAAAEADICNLKQKFDNLELQLNHKREQNHNFGCDSSNKSQQSPSQHQQLRDKHNDLEASATSQHHERSRRSRVRRGTSLDGVDIADEKNQEPSPLPAKHASQTLPLETAHASNSDSGSSSLEPPKPAAPTNSKKSGSRGEGSNSNLSALSRLTTRLNFLKERRSQIATELQNFDKSRASDQPTQSSEKSKGSLSEPHRAQQTADESEELQCPFPYKKSDKPKGSESNRSSQNLDDGVETERQAKSRKPEVRSVKSHERGRSRSPNGRNSGGRSEGQQLHGSAERG